MSDLRTQRRLFMLTSHGALHRPGCPNLKRLKIPPEEVWFDPQYIRPSDTFTAACCWYYGNLTPTVYGWRYDKSGKRLR